MFDSNLFLDYLIARELWVAIFLVSRYILLPLLCVDLSELGEYWWLNLSQSYVIFL